MDTSTGNGRLKPVKCNSETIELSLMPFQLDNFRSFVLCAEYFFHQIYAFLFENEEKSEKPIRNKFQVENFPLISLTQ